MKMNNEVKNEVKKRDEIRTSAGNCPSHQDSFRQQVSLGTTKCQTKRRNKNKNKTKMKTKRKTEWASAPITCNCPSKDGFRDMETQTTPLQVKKRKQKRGTNRPPRHYYSTLPPLGEVPPRHRPARDRRSRLQYD